MALPGWQLARLVEEAASDLVGGVVESVRSHPLSKRLLIILGSRRGKRLMVIGVRGEHHVFYWATKKSEVAGAGSYEPTERFNRIRKARLASLELPQADRIVRVRLERPEGGVPGELLLWIGWTGKAGNFWLVEPTENKVIEARWESSSNRVGQVFVLPSPPHLLDWRTMTYPDYLRAREAEPKSDLADFVRRRLWGIDTGLAQLIARRYESATVYDTAADVTHQFWKEFSVVVGTLRQAVVASCPVIIASGEDIIPALDDRQEEKARAFPSLTAAIAARDALVIGGEGREERLKLVRESIKRRIRQLQRRLRDIDRALASASQAEVLKSQADLLGAQRHLIRKGMTAITLTDWQGDRKVTVPLSATKSPQENIEDLYQRARKTGRAAANAEVVRPQVAEELEDLRSCLAELDAPGVEDERVEKIASRLGVAKQGLRGPKRVQQPHVPYREFRMGEHTILVGRSNRDNDTLTFDIAKPDDLFLHADRVGGSHVILRRSVRGKVFPADVLAAAAQAAAYFSKAKHSGLVPVTYTEVRYVSKPRKAPPGRVRVMREKSVLVRPLPPTGYHTRERGE